MTQQIYKHFVVLAAVLFWLVVLIMITKWRGTRAMSISQHAATNRTTYIFFGLALVAAIAFFLLSMIKYLIPTYGLGRPFEFLLFLVASLFVLGAIIPDTKGWKHTVHYHLARWATIGLMPLIVIITTNSQVSGPVKIIDTWLVLVMFYLWVKVDLMKRSLDKFLLHQMAYFACFHAALIITAYVR